MVQVSFKTNYGEALPKILGFAALFHILVIVVVVGGLWIVPENKPEKIPVFELVKLPPPKGVRHRPKPPVPKPEPVPEVKPEIKPELKPEPKPLPKVDPKPQPKPVPEQVAPPPVPVPEEEYDDNAPEDAPEGDPKGMDLPDFHNEPALRTVESILIDPLMQVYLEQLQAILMGNFNPPAGLEIPAGARTTVQFTIQRSGGMTSIVLKKSSGNPTWDRVAMRAVNLSKLPPLPPNYRAPVLPLVFDFKEK